MGVNSAGVGVVVNNLGMLPSARTGMPVTFIERKLLDTFSVEEASYGLQAMQHAIGQHYLIGDQSNLVSFEADAARVIGGAEDQRVVSHTNHSLYDPPAKPEFETIYAASNTRARYDCMTTLAEWRRRTRGHRDGAHRYLGADQPRCPERAHDLRRHGR